MSGNSIELEVKKTNDNRAKSVKMKKWYGAKNIDGESENRKNAYSK